MQKLGLSLLAAASLLGCAATKMKESNIMAQSDMKLSKQWGFSCAMVDSTITHQYNFMIRKSKQDTMASIIYTKTTDFAAKKFQSVKPINGCEAKDVSRTELDSERLYVECSGDSAGAVSDVTYANIEPDKAKGNWNGIIGLSSDGIDGVLKGRAISVTCSEI